MIRRYLMLRKILILLLSGFIFTTFVFSAREIKVKEKTFDIPNTDLKINVNGALDEKAWDHALKFHLDIEVMPAENVPAPVDTECYLIYDTNHLYVGCRAYDPEPEKIRAYLSDRDEAWQDDSIGLIIDTFNDQNRAFAFFVNPLGVQGDEIMSNGGSEEDTSWDAIWDSAGQITDFGYVVEIAIPFRALQFQPSKKDQIWGFAPVRNYPRSRRHQISSFPLDRNEIQCILCQLPKIRGFSGAEPGRNIELDPTVVGLYSDEREGFPDGPLKKKESFGNIGISGRWGLTNNITLSGALNPDFSQVEADVAQLDINKQFALYYPEKRPFFLEGQDFFETPVQALYTRSIADPSWGVKVSGKEGKNAFGIFSAQDQLTNLIFPGSQGSRSGFLNQHSFSNVLRFRRDVGGGSTLGLLMTDREGDCYHNRLAGLDGLLRINKSDMIAFQFLGSQTAYPDSLAQDYDQDTGELYGYAANVEISRQKKNYMVFGSYKDFSPEFRADLGFIPQVDFRNFEFGGGYQYTATENSFFSQINAAANYDQTNDHQGHLLEKELETQIFLSGPMQSNLSTVVGVRKKVYKQEPFSQFFNHIFFSIQPTGTLQYKVAVSHGDEIDYAHVRAGKYFQISPGLNWNLGTHFNLNLSYLYRWLKIEGKQLFQAQLPQFRFIYHLNRTAFLRAIFQYQDIDRNLDLYDYDVESKTQTLFSQILFSYKLNPRTVLFLGYSDNYLGFTDISLTQTDRTFFLKVGYAWTL
ncbi:MAG: hypothetical protein GF421_00100 [Candidatus Aminicenantes bacterium]|nr:hypothetical protein [Candidatus Aminicenantes bacterium]